jgi:hypothetical protein
MIRNMTMDAYIIAASLLSHSIFGGFAINVKPVANQGGKYEIPNRYRAGSQKSQTERACREGYEKRTAHIGKSGVLEQSRRVDALIAKKQKQMADRDRHEPSR